MLISQAAISNR